MCAATAATTTAGRRTACRQWSYAHALPYFTTQETWEGGASAYRGGDGPLTHAAGRRFEDPLVEAFTRSRRSRRASVRPTIYNGGGNEGFGRNQNTIRDGRRCSAAVAYLRPALARPNLTVETGALVSRIVLEGNRAVGVEYRRGGDSRDRCAPSARCCSPAASSTRRRC